uniref:Uncharacterized protein n=1 Tax=Rhizophora mucronata TaxID=61149 RepID=A0A2P2NTQ0_RHIMU
MVLVQPQSMTEVEVHCDVRRTHPLLHNFLVIACSNENSNHEISLFLSGVGTKDCFFWSSSSSAAGPIISYKMMI